ncbi:MAG: PAS domain S-box protein [Halolamina sp.]
MRILLVDDEPDVADLTAGFLEREDDRIETVVATSGSAGLDRLEDGTFDCVVSDYQMPGLDGLEFLRAARANNPELPFILFTGKGDEGIASEAITAGATDYLQKESGTGQYRVLANRITNAVDRSRAQRRAELHHRALETASEGVSLLAPDGTFSYVNSAFARLFGYDREELLDEHWTVLYHDEEADRLERHILPAVRETGHWAGETVRLTKGGDRLVTDHRLTHTHEDVTICTARDITGERVTATEEETMFDFLVDAVDGYVFYALDHEGYVTRWHEDATRLYGYETSEVLGEHFSLLFAETDRRQATPETLLETAREEGTATHDGALLRKDGSQVQADLTVSADADADGALRGFGTVVDVSAEEAVAQ